MKKIFYVFQIVTLGSLFMPISLFAANAALIASIYNEAVTRVVTISDIEPELLTQNTSITSRPAENVNLVIEVNGVLERLNNENGYIDISSTSQIITSEKDLVNFIKLLVRENLDLTLVSVKGDTVSITRETPAKLFGVLDVSGKETAEVTSWGNGTSAVSVKRPWWSIFSKYDTTSKVVTDSLYAGMKGVSPVLLTPNLNANTKAIILKEIQAAFDENDTKNVLSAE